MAIDVTVKIGGEAGQGIQTVGQLLAQVCRNAGLYAFAINDFESRIRGGHSFCQLRISDGPVDAPAAAVHLLVSMNYETFNLHRGEVAKDGLAILTEKADERDGILNLPVSDLAKQAGSPITANTVAAAAALGVLGAPRDLLTEVLEQRFGGSNGKVAEQNKQAAGLGYEAVQDRPFAYRFSWEGSDKTMLMAEGNQSIALGALAGDCRFASFYPMSPATGIMRHLAAHQDDLPVVVEQAEDEIAAVNMVIGAAYAGVRSITATSGGGFCLMCEGLGLAGISETPLVIVNAQRPGPATGLATRTAQGDLQFVIRAAQDDFPRFVFAPGSFQQGYATTARALALAEKYQTPAVVLVDQYFNDSLQVTDKPFAAPDIVERFIDTDESLDNPEQYRRYALSGDGISPRALPCRGRALVTALGNAHGEDGHLSESAQDRTAMVNKRALKMRSMLSEMLPPETGHPGASLLLVCWGSLKGIVREAVEMMRSKDIDAGWVHFCDIWPFPARDAQEIVSKAERFIVVEQNSTAQFAQLVRQETGLVPSGTVLKYDGRPFYPSEIALTVEQMEK